MNQALKKSFSFVTVAVALANAGCTGQTMSTNLDPRFQSTDSVSFVQDGVSVSSLSNDVSAFASGLSISLSLSINPPLPAQTGGVQVYASDVRVVNGKALTAFNVPGNVQRGWVDLIDVTTLAVPLLLGSQYFADTDINSLAMSSTGNFALVGAKDNVGSVLRTGTWGLLGFSTGATETLLPTYAGTGAVYNGTGSNLAVTTGDAATGGLKVFNSSTLANVGGTTLSDARGVTYHPGTGKYFVVKGQPGAVYAYDSSGAQTGSVALGGASVAESKSTIVAGSQFLLATTGNGGFSVICAADLGIAAQQAQYTYTNYAALGLPTPAQTVSNAAAFGPGMIFVAAGQAGVRVYNFVTKSGASPTACTNVQVSYMGYFEFGNTLSANNIVYQNVLTSLFTYTGVLYVANGLGGFKAVTVVATKSSGNDIIDLL